MWNAVMTNEDRILIAIARLESRFDKLESRFDGLESRFDGLESRFDRLETRFDRLERRVDEFRSELAATNAEVASLRTFVVSLKNDMDDKFEAVFGAIATLQRQVHKLNRHCFPEEFDQGDDHDANGNGRG